MESVQKVEARTSIPIQADELEGFGRFPGVVYLIALGDGLYAANNATIPDGTVVDGLACFRDPENAALYMEWPRGLSGTIESLTFDAARELAKAKMKLNCLLLFSKCKIVEFHFIR